MYTLSYSTFWGFYLTTNDLLKEHSIDNKICRTAISTMIGITIANPLFTIQTRQQLYNTNIRNTIKKLYLTNGIKGFMKGYYATILNSSSLFIQMPLYEYLLEDNNIFVASLSSKIISSIICYPFQVIRSHQRYLNNSINLFNTTKKIYKKGFKHFYGGILIYILASSLNFTALMFAKELLQSL